MSCLDVVIKFREALFLLNDKEDRYNVRKEVIAKCDEIIAEFNEDQDNHYKISYLYDWIYAESRACSDSGHSAAMFYDSALDILQKTRGLSSCDTLYTICYDILKCQGNYELPHDLSVLLRKLGTFFE